MSDPKPLSGSRAPPRRPLRERDTMICGSCSIPPTGGECPACGTYWFTHGGKWYAVAPGSFPATRIGPDGRTTPLYWHELPNCYGPMSRRPLLSGSATDSEETPR